MTREEEDKHYTADDLLDQEALDTFVDDIQTSSREIICIVCLDGENETTKEEREFIVRITETIGKANGEFVGDDGIGGFYYYFPVAKEYFEKVAGDIETLLEEGYESGVIKGASLEQEYGNREAARSYVR